MGEREAKEGVSRTTLTYDGEQAPDDRKFHQDLTASPIGVVSPQVIPTNSKPVIYSDSIKNHKIHPGRRNYGRQPRVSDQRSQVSSRHASLTHQGALSSSDSPPQGKEITRHPASAAPAAANCLSSPRTQYPSPSPPLEGCNVIISRHRDKRMLVIPYAIGEYKMLTALRDRTIFSTWRDITGPYSLLHTLHIKEFSQASY